MLLPPSPSCLDLFVMLAFGHCVADFGLQSDRMAVEKCPGKGETLPWGYWLASHAGIHAFFVAWITGLPLLGVAEWCLHAVIDLGKCSGLYRLRLDQILHLFCKLLWAVLACRLLATG